MRFLQLALLGLFLLALPACGNGETASPSQTPRSQTADGAPATGGINVKAGTTVGTVTSKSRLKLRLLAASNVSRVVYTLDRAPLEVAGSEDLTAESSTGGDFAAEIDLVGLRNQQVRLVVDCFNAAELKVTETVEPLWVFNQLGDIDANGETNSQDTAALSALLGLGVDDPGFLGYADLNHDGRITEVDAAVIGYYWSTGTEPPTVVLEATPRSGPAPLVVQFDAGGSSAPGGIVKYEWDWDLSGDYDEETTTPQNSHTFLSEEVHTVRVRITSQQGETATGTIDIRVSDQPTFGTWQQYGLGSLGSQPQFNDLWAVTCDDRPAVLWYNSDTKELRAAWADTEQPATAADWDVQSLGQGPPTASWGLCLADMGGVPAAVHLQPGNSLVYSTWGADGWASHVALPAVNDWFYADPVLAQVAGKPALLCRAKLTGSGGDNLYYVYATVSNPTSSADWVHGDVFIETPGEYTLDFSRDHPLALLEAGGLPHIGFMVSHQGQKRRYLGRATTATPASPADWVTYDAFFSNGYVDMALLDGLPAFVNASREFHRTPTLLHAAPLDWSFYFPLDEFSGPEQTQLELIAGLPTMAWFQGVEGLRVSQALQVDPGPADWFVESVEPVISADRPFRLAHGGNQPVLFVNNAGSLDYCYPAQ
jgi:PKD repeat protein